LEASDGVSLSLEECYCWGKLQGGYPKTIKGFLTSAECRGWGGRS